MIVFVSPGLVESREAVGTLGLHLSREEAIDLRNVLTDALNASVDEEVPLKAWFTYGACYAEKDPPVNACEVETIPPSPFADLEDWHTDSFGDTLDCEGEPYGTNG